MNDDRRQAGAGTPHIAKARKRALRAAQAVTLGLAMAAAGCTTSHRAPTPAGDGGPRADGGRVEPDAGRTCDVFPAETHHGWKFIAFGPDDRLYVPVGAPCNVCLSGDVRFASIMRMRPDGSELEVFARGIRNTVGFDWHPATGELWFTDNGRDWMGDNQPPCELNRATEHDQHFGYPYWHGTSLPDPEFGAGHSADEFELPVQDLGPHVAPLGLEFYTGDMFPEEYRNQVFIAERGSWNRTIPIGYRVTLVRLDGSGNATSYEDFAAGWLRRTKAWGRVVDLEVMPDGSMLVSDDTAGVIYRISYAAPSAAAK